MRMLAVIFNEIYNANAISELPLIFLDDRLQLLTLIRVVLDVKILV